MRINKRKQRQTVQNERECTGTFVPILPLPVDADGDGCMNLASASRCDDGNIAWYRILNGDWAQRANVAVTAGMDGDFFSYLAEHC